MGCTIARFVVNNINININNRITLSRTTNIAFVYSKHPECLSDKSKRRKEVVICVCVLYDVM